MPMPITDSATLNAAHARSRAVAAAWPETPGHAAADALFAGAQSTAQIAERAEQLLADDAWAEALLAPLIANLRADPWFQPPFRVDRDALRIGAVLYEHPLVAITASILSADVMATLPPPRSIVVTGRQSVIRYRRAGGARLRIWQTTPAPHDFSSTSADPCLPISGCDLHDGQILHIDGRIRAHLVEHASADIVTMMATIRRDTAPFMREYAIADGSLLRTVSLDDSASRVQMLLALLRHMGRVDARDCLEAASHDPAFFVRWAAMREWLALDVRSALPRLRAMCSDPNAEVRAAAQTMARIVEERVPCPA